MKSIICLLSLVVLTGCVQLSGERTAPDGSKLRITSNRFLWVSQDMTFTTKTADGVSVTLKAANSRSDVEAINALAEIAKTAVAK